MIQIGRRDRAENEYSRDQIYRIKPISQSALLHGKLQRSQMSTA